MSPSWSRGDLDLSLFSGICPSVSRLRGQGRAGQGRAGRGAAASGRSVAPASSEYGLFSCPLSSTLSGNWDPGGKGVDIQVPEAVRGG